jgi:hypothetical protein
MFERLITAILILVAVAIVASGFPLSSLTSTGPNGFFGLPLIF